MKTLILSSVFLANTVYAQMPQEKMDAIAATVTPFRADCLEKNKIVDVKAINISNKTAESLDKKSLSESLAKALNVTLNDKSQSALSVVLKAKSTEVEKVRNTTYDLEVALKDSKKEVCKKSYSQELTETR